ncbi:MAG: hypothetical protein ABL989_11865 [Gammaproteobacteria bacterium]
MTPEPDLTLSREDLYELVWSKPMVELAQDLGLSDVALAKRCRKLGVPVPGRGYWARVASGQEPHRPKLPKRDVPTYDSALVFAPIEESPPPDVEDPAPEADAVRTQIDGIAITIAPGLEAASPPVQRLAHRLKVIPAKDIAWAHRADRQGPIPQIAVSEAQADRALRIVDAVLRGAEVLGWPFEAVKPKDTGHHRRSVEPPEPLPPGAITVDGEPFAIRIDEPQRRRAHVPTADEVRRKQREAWVHIPAWDFDWSGNLHLQIHEPDSRYGQRTFKDGKRRRLEDQVRDVLHGLHDMALHAKARRKEHEQRERGRREEERLAWERSERRDAELKLINELERQAGAWFRARLLHRYVRAARRALGQTHIEAQRGDEPVDFFAWAEGYVNQLDPLHPAARNTDLLGGRAHWEADQAVQKGLARLAGFEGQTAWKIVGQTDNDRGADWEDDE